MGDVYTFTTFRRVVFISCFTCLTCCRQNLPGIAYPIDAYYRWLHAEFTV